MSKFKKLLILLLAAIVLAGAWVAVQYFTSEEDEEDSTVEAVYGSLCGFETDDITSLSWSAADAVYTVTLQEDGSWLSDYNEEMPISPDEVTELLDSFTAIEYERKLEAVEDFEQYGLTEPQLSLSITAGDEEYTFAVGDVSPINGYTYIRRNSEAAVYLVSADPTAIFDVEPLDLALTETVADTMSYDTLRVDSATYVRTYDLSYTNDHSWKSGTFFADSDTVDSLCSSLLPLDWVKNVCFDPDEDDLELYGLSDPLEVTVEGETSQSYLLGKTTTETETVDDEGNTVIENTDTWYAMLPGGSFIYEIDAGVGANLEKAATPRLIRANDVCSMDFATVNSMEIETADCSYTLELSKDAETEELTYTIDGTEADSEAVENVFTLISGLTAAGECSESEALGEAAVTITFHRNTENFSEMVFRLCKYNSDNYRVDFDSSTRLLVAAESVDELKSALEALASASEE